MKKNKTPDYTRKAVKKYEQQFTHKMLPLHKINDKELIDAINNDDEPYVHVAKKLLKDYYHIK